MRSDELPLSPTEWNLLRIASKLESPDIHQILEMALQQGCILDYRTTCTLLARLVGRGFLETIRGQDRNLRYVMRVDPNEVLRRMVESFVKEVVGDDPAQLDIVREVVAAQG